MHNATGYRNVTTPAFDVKTLNNESDMQSLSMPDCMNPGPAWSTSTAWPQTAWDQAKGVLILVEWMKVPVFLQASVEGATACSVDTVSSTAWTWTRETRSHLLPWHHCKQTQMTTRHLPVSKIIWNVFYLRSNTFLCGRNIKLRPAAACSYYYLHISSNPRIHPCFKAANAIFVISQFIIVNDYSWP